MCEERLRQGVACEYKSPLQLLVAMCAISLEAEAVPVDQQMLVKH